MENNERLEILSDKVRRGEPIDFIEALEVIVYQTQLKKHRKENSITKKIKRFFKRIYRGGGVLVMKIKNNSNIGI